MKMNFLMQLCLQISNAPKSSNFSKIKIHYKFPSSSFFSTNFHQTLLSIDNEFPRIRDFRILLDRIDK